MKKMLSLEMIMELASQNVDAIKKSAFTGKAIALFTKTMYNNSSTSRRTSFPKGRQNFCN